MHNNKYMYLSNQTYIMTHIEHIEYTAWENIKRTAFQSPLQSCRSLYSLSPYLSLSLFLSFSLILSQSLSISANVSKVVQHRTISYNDCWQYLVKIINCKFCHKLRQLLSFKRGGATITSCVNHWHPHIPNCSDSSIKISQYIHILFLRKHAYSFLKELQM